MYKNTIKGTDGFTITYMVAGDREKSPLILVNAYGMNPMIWKNVIDYFSYYNRVVIWETRGTHEEDMDLEMTGKAQAGDLACIMDHEEIGRADFICWCSGLKILLEYYRREPGRYRTISIINGYYEPLDGGPGQQTPYDKYIASLGQFVLKNTGAFLQQKNIPVILSKIFSFDIQKRVLNTTNREEAEREKAIKMQEMPPEEVKPYILEPFLNQKKFINYVRLIQDLHRHNISGILSAVEEPVLVISSERDVITYPGSAEKALQKLKYSTHVYLKGAGHWVIWDRHREVNPVILEHIQHAKSFSGVQAPRRGADTPRPLQGHPSQEGKR